MVKHYDGVIIGSGQGGNPLAGALANAGWKVAVIEKEHVGGTCINEGCTPTKTMVASARVAYLARRAADYGVNTGTITVDLSKVRQRKRDIVNSFRGGGEKHLQNNPNITLLMGTARFISANSIEIKLNNGGTEDITAAKIFINTGARSSVPPIKGLENIPFLNSTSIMELGEVPEHLIVLGGGYIGLEFAQMFRRFGSQVTIVNRSANLLGREDPDVAEEVAKILQQDGIEILFNTATLEVAKSGDNGVTVKVKTAENERTLNGSHLLVATGRTPNTEELNPKAAGIETDKRGFIPVNEKLETNVPNIYALGDVNGGPAFTHISYDDFRILRANLLEGGNATTKERLLPYTVFIDPQVGRIGISETEAREKGLNIKIAKMPMEWVARALEMAETRGFMKAIVSADTDQILGGVIIGIEGGEMMSVLQMAMLGKLPYTVLKEAVFAHPLLAEAYNNLFQSLI
jgi:pyruvate/2-oxoglutarate dehydrogenase complex dihydrolipoamide dehydrogenase (E3) component